MSTFKDVKVELSTSADFSPETTEVIFKQADVEETIANKGQPQVIQLPAPINARYIRIWGRGHYIQNTNSSWKGYSNGVLFNEIEVLAQVEADAGTNEEPQTELVNLAKLKNHISMVRLQLIQKPLTMESSTRIILLKNQ